VSQFHFRHSGQAKRDPESRNIKEFWIPAFAGMTTFYYSDTVSGRGLRGGETLSFTLPQIPPIEGGVMSYCPFTIASTSVFGSVIGLMLKFSTRTLRTFGDANAGSVGPRRIPFTPR